MAKRHVHRPFLGGVLLGASLAAGSAWGNCGPDALGTSRTLVLKREGAAYGRAQHEALPLEPGEVVITFDDGPRPESTPAVLQALQAQCVRATFFMNGEPLARHRELAQRVRAEGHSVGMHGYQHPHFAAMAEAEQLADLAAMQQAYQQVFGASAPAYRFPFLEETPTLMAALKAQAVTVMSVDAGIDDWLPDQTPQVLADRLVERLQRSGGGIILLHDAQDQTAAALPLLLKTLKEQGLRVVHLEWAAAGSIQVNQVGFLPGAAKWAVVPDVAATGFEVVDAGTGAAALRGTLGAAAIWEPAQESVRLADFSSLAVPGTYRLRVEGLADSPPFTIAADAYAALNAASIKAFYFNRASTALLPGQAGVYAREAGHPDTQVHIHASAAGPGRPEGTVISSPKGWYDAGDYNKYIVNSGITTYTLLAAYEHFPALFQKQTLNIPESGNAIPDLLDEALWNLEWMLTMQDPADGGVYHKLTDKGFDGLVMPHQATSPRYVVQKTTAAALDFAAVMATASRVFAGFEAQRPGLAARMRAAALAAWGWADKHPDVIYRQPPDIHTGGYDDSELEDEFAWAAAELYITTRDDSFYAAMKPERLPAGVPGWNDVGGLAWMSLAHHRQRLTPAADQRLIAERIGGLARQLAAAWASSPYRIGLNHAKDMNWGSNAGLLNQAMMLIQGYRLTGDRQQLDAAQSALDYVLGRNALVTSMVTGFGARSPQHPHHRPSEADGVAAPVPGFIVGGPNAGRQDAANCPVPYASTEPAKAWLDHVCSYASNEIAINWNAPLVYVSAAVQVLSANR
ncbi:glycoside hydrolase family 9 protein [Ideonella sp.]|uniref:glycoside hydrolase family 9 protein n=1 Tax=Ideonella sp. TaxID=1929293 RepID=UPI002B46FB15|nr:glycoside hydrolase family 9 protein [Ideonella sp.]HJV69888.1 glycoside hydrolase family 9 protein [Ideonella sp.]